jgi:hypothetical protein
MKKDFLSTGSIVYLKDYQGITDPMIDAFAGKGKSPVPRGTQFTVDKIVYDEGEPLVLVSFEEIKAKKPVPMNRFAHWPRHWDHKSGDLVEILLFTNSGKKRYKFFLVSYIEDGKILVELTHNTAAKLEAMSWNSQVPTTYMPKQSNKYKVFNRTQIVGSSDTPEDVYKIPAAGMTKNEIVYVNKHDFYGYAVAESLVDGRILVNMATTWPGHNVVVGSSAASIEENSPEFKVPLSKDDSPGKGTYYLAEKSELITCNQFNQPFAVYLGYLSRADKEKILRELWNRFITWASKSPLSVNLNNLYAVKYKPKIGLLPAAIKTGSIDELKKDSYPIWEPKKILGWEVKAFQEPKQQENKSYTGFIHVDDEDDYTPFS